MSATDLVVTDNYPDFREANDNNNDLLRLHYHVYHVRGIGKKLQANALVL